MTSHFGGALRRDPMVGYRWSDGTPEPRASDMLMRHCAPNFRCAQVRGRTRVEIPAGWRDAAWWPAHRVDAVVEERIAALIAEAGQAHPIFAERLAETLDDHRLTTDGWIVDLAMWEAVMCEPRGVWWDSEHDADMRARALALGWSGD